MKTSHIKNAFLLRHNSLSKAHEINILHRQSLVFMVGQKCKND